MLISKDHGFVASRNGPMKALVSHFEVRYKARCFKESVLLKSVISAVISSMVEAFSATERHGIPDTQFKISALHQNELQTNKQKNYSDFYLSHLEGVYRRHVLSLQNYTKPGQSHLL